MFNTHHLPGTDIRALSILNNLIFIATIWASYYTVTISISMWGMKRLSGLARATQPVVDALRQEMSQVPPEPALPPPLYFVL